MADAFPWDQPSFRRPRSSQFFFLSLSFSPGWSVSSREIKSNSNGCLLPLPSLFSRPPLRPCFTAALIFFYARTLATRERFTRETRARLTRCVSNRFSFAEICLLCSACLAALCRRNSRASRLLPAFTFNFNARLVAGFDFQRGGVREHEYIEISKVLKVVQIF